MYHHKISHFTGADSKLKGLAPPSYRSKLGINQALTICSQEKRNYHKESSCLRIWQRNIAIMEMFGKNPSKEKSNRVDQQFK